MPASVVMPFRLPQAVLAKLDELAALVNKPRAQVLRAIILNATPAALPRSWLEVDAHERQVIGVAERLDRGK
jgi:predicted transcriptional regulator